MFHQIQKTDISDTIPSNTLKSIPSNIKIRLNAKIPHLLRIMKQRRLASPEVHLNLSTIYRFLHHHNLMEQNKSKPEDHRRYEAKLPNDIWQSDVMHGPKVKIGNKMRKSYLIAFIDDHSRLIPYGGFYSSESAKSPRAMKKFAQLNRPMATYGCSSPRISLSSESALG